MMLRYDGLYLFLPSAADMYEVGSVYLRFYEDGTIVRSGYGGPPEQAPLYVHRDDELNSIGRYTFADGVLSYYAFVEASHRRGMSMDGRQEWQLFWTLHVTCGTGTVEKDRVRLRHISAQCVSGKLIAHEGPEDEAGIVEYLFVEVSL